MAAPHALAGCHAGALVHGANIAAGAKSSSRASDDERAYLRVQKQSGQVFLEPRFDGGGKRVERSRFVQGQNRNRILPCYDHRPIVLIHGSSCSLRRWSAHTAPPTSLSLSRAMSVGS